MDCTHTVLVNSFASSEAASEDEETIGQINWAEDKRERLIIEAGAYLRLIPGYSAEFLTAAHSLCWAVADCLGITTKTYQSMCVHYHFIAEEVLDALLELLMRRTIVKREDDIERYYRKLCDLIWHLGSEPLAVAVAERYHITWKKKAKGRD